MEELCPNFIPTAIKKGDIGTKKFPSVNKMFLGGFAVVRFLRRASRNLRSPPSSGEVLAEALAAWPSNDHVFLSEAAARRGGLFFALKPDTKAVHQFPNQNDVGFIGLSMRRSHTQRRSGFRP